MKKIYITTIICSLVMISIFGVFFYFQKQREQESEVLKIGFLYVGDASNPYTNNFIRVQKAIENMYGDKVQIFTKENVSEGTEKEPLKELIAQGCGLIFSTSYGYGDTVKKIAEENPSVQFCQATCSNANEDPQLSNYHTAMGHIYQGRYVAGMVAGMKMKELISRNKIKPEEAKIGYVAAFPYAEVISGYTAFLLGAKSVVPEATMSVRYTNTWGNYSIEKKIAKKFIKEKCVIISQHSDTIGPAVACEEARITQSVFHVGYNQSMIDVAPTTSLVSCRINWEPYMMAAVQAVLDKKKIEDQIEGVINGNDAGAGFAEGWVEMLELNNRIIAEGTANRIEANIENFEEGKIHVFKGDYKGVDPFDEKDTIDLNKEYIENEKTSAPLFHYVLSDIIKVED